MKLRALIIVAAVAGMLAGLTGCTNYSCKNFPKGTCQNMSQVYDDTGKNFQDYRQGTGKQAKYDKKKAGINTVVVSNTVKGINELSAGDPVLTKPQVLRAWIKPWEDKEKDLNYSFVYIRVKDSEWTVLQ